MPTPRITRLGVLGALVAASASCVFALAGAGTREPGSPDAQAARQRATQCFGVVRDEQGRPLPGVTIKLYTGFAARFLVQTRITGPEGAFRFAPLIAANGWNEEQMTFGFVVEHPWLCRADGKAYEEVTITQGQALEHNVTMAQGGAVEAHVIDKVGGDG